MSYADITKHMAALGVSPGAPADVVKDAWRKAAKKAHPDIAGAGSTERMARINAAYEALKNGAPTEPPKSSASAAHKASSWHAKPQARPAKARSVNIRNAMMTCKDAHRTQWRERAIKRLDKRGVQPLKTTFFQRFRKQADKYAILVPERIRIVNGAVEIILDRPRLWPGQNYIAVPEFVPENGVIAVTSNLNIFDSTLNSGDGVARLFRATMMDKHFMPGYPSIKVFMSTSQQR